MISSSQANSIVCVDIDDHRFVGDDGGRILDFPVLVGLNFMSGKYE
jgi:hypothetical protein